MANVSFRMASGSRSVRVSTPARVYAHRTVGVAEPLPVGRGPELARLTAGLDRLQGETGVCLAVEGDAGIGKSHLLRALRSEAYDRGHLVLGGPASEYEG